VTGPIKFVADYLSPTQPLVEKALTECLSGGFPVLMAEDLNTKYTEWNCGFTTTGATFLLDYINRNSCFICGTDSPTTAPCIRNVTSEVLGKVIVNDFVLPVQRIVWFRITHLS
jgi:hypothetical protein